MSREEAHRLLDAVRAGLPVPEPKINAALLVTGDLDTAPTTLLHIATAQYALDPYAFNDHAFN